MFDKSVTPKPKEVEEVDDKLKKYRELVEKLGDKAITSKASSEAKKKFKELQKELKNLMNEIPTTDDMEGLVQRITEIKNSIKELGFKPTDAVRAPKGASTAALRGQIKALREEILNEKHFEGWDKWIEYYKANPHVLTAIIHQTGYEDMDHVQTLARLPFRGSANPGGGRRKHVYVLHLEDGNMIEKNSISECVNSFDTSMPATVSWATLQKYVEKGVTIGGVRVSGVERVPVSNSDDTDNANED